jgi:hypothetical protein
VADTKITGLTAIAAIASGDLVPVVDDPAGTPVTKKATVDQLQTFIAPAASDTAAGRIEIADQSEMEAGSDTGRAVTPGRQHFHPSAAKFWVKATANSTTVVVSYNMTSWADTGVGDADGTIATDFSGADWCGMVSIIDATLAWDATFTEGYGFNAHAAGTFGVLCGKMQDGGTAAATVEDPDSWHVAGFGDHT